MFEKVRDPEVCLASLLGYHTLVSDYSFNQRGGGDVEGRVPNIYSLGRNLDGHKLHWGHHLPARHGRTCHLSELLGLALLNRDLSS